MLARYPTAAVTSSKSFPSLSQHSHPHAGKFDWKQGRISGGAFSGKKDNFTKLLTVIYGQYALSNPLHCDIFPGVRKMEAEIVKMTLDIFHGDKDACGCVSGDPGSYVF